MTGIGLLSRCRRETPARLCAALPSRLHASGLLSTYLGEDAGRRVHAGSIMRGSVDTLRAVIWYADIRGFTPISDSAPGPIVVELLNDVFEILTASLRVHGGQVLKFIGDAMLAVFSFDEHDRAETCRHALAVSSGFDRGLRRNAMGMDAK